MHSLRLDRFSARSLNVGRIQLINLLLVIWIGIPALRSYSSPRIVRPKILRVQPSVLHTPSEQPIRLVELGCFSIRWRFFPVLFLRLSSSHHSASHPSHFHSASSLLFPIPFISLIHRPSVSHSSAYACCMNYLRKECSVGSRCSLRFRFRDARFCFFAGLDGLGKEAWFCSCVVGSRIRLWFLRVGLMG